MNSIKFWRKIHQFQKKDDWCGPAVIQMVLLAVGFKKTQEEIARAVFKKWWGTNQQIVFTYLSKFFHKIKFKNNSSIEDIKYHLKKNHLIIVDWWDDLGKGKPDGHYSIIIGYNRKQRSLIMADPSMARNRIWNIPVKDFKNRWYDSLDVHGTTWVDGWMIWIDPSSKIS